MPKNFIPSALKFVDQINGSHHGQKDHRIDLFENGTWVASLDYSEYHGEPSIHFIAVAEPSNRRRGFATELVQRLQQTYPGRQLSWLGVATRDGASFYAALPKIERPVKSVIDRKRHLASLIRQRDAILASADHLNCSEVHALNELHDNIADLENSLGGKSSVCILIDTKDAVPYPGTTLSA